MCSSFFYFRPSLGIRAEIAPMWIPPCTPDDETEVTPSPLGTIGAEVRRRPRQRYVQQKLPVLNTRTCTLHDKPKDGTAILSPGRPEQKQNQESIYQHFQAESPNVRTQSGYVSAGLIRIPTGHSEDASHRKEVRAKIKVKLRQGSNPSNDMTPGGKDQDKNITNGAMIERPPKKTASSRRYIMSWLDAGSDEPQFSERFKLQSAKYKSRKELERLQKVSDEQTNKSPKEGEKEMFM